MQADKKNNAVQHRKTLKQNDLNENAAIASTETKLRQASLPGNGDGSMATYAGHRQDGPAARTAHMGARAGRQLSQVVHQHATAHQCTQRVTVHLSLTHSSALNTLARLSRVTKVPCMFAYLHADVWLLGQDDPMVAAAVASTEAKLRQASLSGNRKGSTARSADLAARTARTESSSGRRLSQVDLEHEPHYHAIDLA